VSAVTIDGHLRNALVDGLRRLSGWTWTRGLRARAAIRRL